MTLFWGCIYILHPFHNIFYFHLWICTAFPIKLPLSQPRNFFAFTPPIPPPIPLPGVCGCMVLDSWMGLIHNTPRSPFPPPSWLKNFFRSSHFRLNNGHTGNSWNTENLWNSRRLDLHLFYHKNCVTHIFSNLLQCKRIKYGFNREFQSKQREAWGASIFDYSVHLHISECWRC